MKALAAKVLCLVCLLVACMLASSFATPCDQAKGQEADSGRIHSHVVFDVSNVTIDDDQIKVVVDRVNHIWNPHGIDFSFDVQRQTYRSDSVRHIHLKHGVRTGYTQGVCATVGMRKPDASGLAETGSIVAHEIGHWLHLENNT